VYPGTTCVGRLTKIRRPQHGWSLQHARWSESVHTHSRQPYASAFKHALCPHHLHRPHLLQCSRAQPVPPGAEAAGWHAEQQTSLQGSRGAVQLYTPLLRLNVLQALQSMVTMLLCCVCCSSSSSRDGPACCEAPAAHQPSCTQAYLVTCKLPCGGHRKLGASCCLAADDCRCYGDACTAEAGAAPRPAASLIMMGITT
jgi:hypothetical protein